MNYCFIVKVESPLEATSVGIELADRGHRVIAAQALSDREAMRAPDELADNMFTSGCGQERAGEPVLA
jgi:hypothetical protein